MLQAETAESQWHTGDPETDPWQWKDRAAMEKKLAFGCILGGYKGFISKELYPLFYAACHPAGDAEELYDSGELSHAAWQLYQLLEHDTVLSTADIRKALHVTKKSGASRVDTAVEELQRKFYITVCGNRRKVALNGQEYGWPANTYTRVEDWIPEDWLHCAENIDPEGARSRILDIGCSIGSGIDRQALSKLLFKK
jgi:hypothetical protein